MPGKFPTTPRSFLLENVGKGNFLDATPKRMLDFQQVGMVTSVETGDLDGDGKPEIVVAGDWQPIKIFKFDGSTYQNVTQNFGLDNTSGWWNCLIIKDLDSDGDLDVVAGNEGWNHRLGKKMNLPLQLFAADFDSNGSIDPLVCLTDGSFTRPAANAMLFASQFPQLFKKRLLRYQKFSAASVHHIFSENELSAAQVLDCQILATVWLENQGGKFVLHELPDLAQIAPAQSILAEDFTGDGHLDLLILGNEFDSEIETYRQDASNGVLLAGDGRGNFQVISSEKSGMWAGGAARRAHVLKLVGGRRAVFIANNSDLPSFFWLKK